MGARHASAKPRCRSLTVVLVHGGGRRTHQGTLGVGQKRIPDVQDENRPRLIAPVPGFVLEVSSNTHAWPGRHSRVSEPTRKPHPAGTTSGTCTTRRVLVTPVWGGMRV